MTAPPPGLRRGDPWSGYAEALGTLHTARDAAVEEHRAARRAEAERAAELTRLGARLGEQQRALVELAARLRAPITPADLTPFRPTSVVMTAAGSAAAAEARAVGADVDAAGVALAEAHRVAALPQLLPAWRSPLARAAVVYAGFAIPSLLLTVALSAEGVRENTAVLVWFTLGWPAVTAVAGALVVARVSQPRADGSVREGQEPEVSATGTRARPRRYPWLGVLLAWASWLVTGAVLDWFASFLPG